MSKETETRIKRLIGKVNTVEELHRIRKHVSTRIDLIHKRESKAELDRLWNAVASCKPGDELEATKALDVFYLHQRPSIRREVHVGDRFVVWQIQPRARRVWAIPPRDDEHRETIEHLIGQALGGDREAWRALNRLSTACLEPLNLRRLGIRRADVDRAVEAE